MESLLTLENVKRRLGREEALSSQFLSGMVAACDPAHNSHLLELCPRPQVPCCPVPTYL